MHAPNCELRLAKRDKTRYSEYVETGTPEAIACGQPLKASSIQQKNQNDRLFFISGQVLQIVCLSDVGCVTW